jgi:hypothetical protein
MMMMMITMIIQKKLFVSTCLCVYVCVRVIIHVCIVGSDITEDCRWMTALVVNVVMCILEISGSPL